MVVTRGSTTFATQWPLFHAILTDTCTPELCAQHGATQAPGGLTPAHIAALRGSADALAALAASAPLNTALTAGWYTAELHAWLQLARIGRREARCLQLGYTPLDVALSRGQVPCVTVLLDAGINIFASGSPLDWRLKSETEFLHDVVQRLCRGELAPVSSSNLRRVLAAAVRASKPELFLQLLKVSEEGCAAGQQVLTLQDATLLLQDVAQYQCLEAVEAVVRLGADLSGPSGHQAVVMAANIKSCMALRALLKAGAAVTFKVVQAVISSMDPDMLAVLLRYGTLPPDTRTVLNHPDYNPYGCPVLFLLRRYAQINKQGYFQWNGTLCNSKHASALLMAEQLAAAGLKPTIYRNVVVRPSTVPVPEFDPLVARPTDFDLEGVNKYLWMVLQGNGWSPAMHKEYPPALKSAFKTVLLVVARAARGCAQLDVEASLRRKGNLLDFQGTTGGKEQCKSLPILLSRLPQELLLSILAAAAAPLSVWIKE